MALVNTSKPSAPSFSNTNRVLNAETWATITTTWASETRTWAGLVSDMSNISKQSSSITNIAKP